MNKLSQFSQISLVICTVFLSIVSPVNAIKIDNKYYCYLTIQSEDNSTFKILVPEDKIKIIFKQLNVVGLNCRGHN